MCVVNSEDLDLTPPNMASDLGLHCLLRPFPVPRGNMVWYVNQWKTWMEWESKFRIIVTSACFNVTLELWLATTGGCKWSVPWKKIYGWMFSLYMEDEKKQITWARPCENETVSSGIFSQKESRVAISPLKVTICIKCQPCFLGKIKEMIQNVIWNFYVACKVLQSPVLRFWFYQVISWVRGVDL